MEVLWRASVSRGRVWQGVALMGFVISVGCAVFVIAIRWVPVLDLSEGNLLRNSVGPAVLLVIGSGLPVLKAVRILFGLRKIAMVVSVEGPDLWITTFDGTRFVIRAASRSDKLLLLPVADSNTGAGGTQFVRYQGGRNTWYVAVHDATPFESSAGRAFSERNRGSLCEPTSS